MRYWKSTTAVLAIAAIAATTHVTGGLDTLTGLLSKPALAAAPPAEAMQAMPVPVAAVIKKDLPLYLTYTARTEAIRSVALKAKVSGYIQTQAARDGSDVEQGELLYQIDRRDYQAALDQAKAQLRRDAASLGYNEGNMTRGSDLNKTGFLSKDGYDQRANALEQSQATVAASKAALQAAQINLDYTEIRAPFDGRLGRNEASEGALVTAGSNALNTLVQISPIYVTFAPSETDLALIRNAQAAGKVTAEVAVPGNSGSLHSGELTFIDNAVDPATGTIMARATIANADRVLLPGQYVDIRLNIGETPNALLVPQVALGSGQLGKFVYVVDDGKVAMRPVELGQTDGENVAVLKGIKDSDQIITGNLQKIGPGAPVQPMPAAAADGGGAKLPTG